MNSSITFTDEQLDDIYSQIEEENRVMDSLRALDQEESREEMCHERLSEQLSGIYYYNLGYDLSEELEEADA